MTPQEPRLLQRVGMFVTNIPFKLLGNKKEEVINNLINALYSIKGIESGSAYLYSGLPDTIQFIVTSYRPSIKKEIKDKIVSAINDEDYQPKFLFDVELENEYYTNFKNEGETSEKGWFMFSLFAKNSEEVSAILRHLNKRLSPVTPEGKPNKLYDPFLGIYSVVVLHGMLFIYADRSETVYNKILSFPGIYFEPQAKTGQVLVPINTKSDINRYIGDKTDATEIGNDLSIIQKIITGAGGKEATASMLEYIKNNNSRVTLYVDLSLVPNFGVDSIIYIKQELPIGTHKANYSDFPDWLKSLRNLEVLSNRNKNAALQYTSQPGESLEKVEMSFTLKSKVYSELMSSSESGDVLRDPTQIKNRMVLKDQVKNIGTFSEANGFLDSKKLFDIFSNAEGRASKIISERFPEFFKEVPSEVKKEGATTEKNEKVDSSQSLQAQLKKIADEIDTIKSSIANVSEEKAKLIKQLDLYSQSRFQNMDVSILENLNEEARSLVENATGKSFDYYIDIANATRNFNDEYSSQVYWIINEFAENKKNEMVEHYDPILSEETQALESKHQEYSTISREIEKRGPEEKGTLKEEKGVSEEDKNFVPHFNYEIRMSAAKGLYGKASVFLESKRNPKEIVFNVASSTTESPNIDMLLSEEGKRKILEEAQKLVEGHKNDVVPVLHSVLQFFPENISGFDSVDTKQAITFFGNFKVVQISDIDKGAMEKRIQETGPEDSEKKEEV